MMNFITRHFKKKGPGRKLVTCAWPLALAGLSQALMANMDAAMVGRISLDAIAALGVASTVMNFFVLIANGLAFGLNTTVAQELGSRSMPRVGRAVLTGVQMSLLIGPVLAVVAWFSIATIYRVMGLEGVVLELALRYSRIFVGLVMIAPMNAMIAACFAAHTHTRIIMVASSLMLVINLLANYALIFGHWGFPALGVAGAAIGSVASMAVSCLFFAGYLWLRHRHYHLHEACCETGFIYYGLRIVRVGSTVVADWGIWFGCMLILNALLVRCGTKEVALFNVGMKLQSLCFIWVGGVMQAGAALIGQAVGNRRPSRARLWAEICRLIGFISMVPAIGALLFFPASVFRIYMRAEDVAQLDHLRWVGVVLALLLVVRVNNTVLSTTFRCMGILSFTLMCVCISETLMLTAASLLLGVMKLGALAGFGVNLMEESTRAVLYRSKYLNPMTFYLR